MTDVFYEDVARHLRQQGVNATAENTGGWIYCVLIPDAQRGGTWYFGTANVTWGGDLVPDGDMCAGSKPTTIETGVDSDCDDAHVVAAAILVGLWVFNHKEEDR